MNILDRLHARARENKWMGYFAVFLRIALAAGFLPSGWVKIMGERFTALSSLHPMGSYLEALHHTGYYYTFIGIMQVTAALLLLIPRTATLGAVIYFPIILNICILSLAVRFDGSLVSSPLMVFGCLYLLCWDYHKFRPILISPPLPKPVNSRFPWRFFGGVFATMVAMVLVLHNVFNVMPRNSYSDCMRQFEKSRNIKAGIKFCDCIHNQGMPLDKALEEYKKDTR